MNVPFRPLTAIVTLAVWSFVCQPALAVPSGSDESRGRRPSSLLQQFQTAQPSPPLKAESERVSVNVLVTDEDGRVLTGLRQGNFRILDNGVPQHLETFAPTTAPITIVMLLEYSAASYDYFARKAATWGTGFLNHLEAQDWVALTTFDLKSQVRVDFTHKRFEVRDALVTLGPPQFREVNLFDALIDTLDQLDRVRGRKSILLLATGANTFSSSSFDELVDRLRKSDVTIFVVGLAEEEFIRYETGNLSYTQAKSWLNTFARQTGGMAQFPRFSTELPDIFRSVVGFLRSEYTLSFRPAEASRDGKYHRISVEIVGPDGKPLKVTDEKGRKRKVEVYARAGYIARKATAQ